MSALALAACGQGVGTSGNGTAPVATLSASQSAVAAGESATLTWTTSNAVSCSGSGGWSGNLATSGSAVTGALMATTSFTLTCTGIGGTSTIASTSVTVDGAPTVTLTAAPTDLPSGMASTLTWASTNATACTASGGWTGNLATSGTRSTGALTANTTYTLTCSGTGGGSAAASTTVTVNALPMATLTAAPADVPNGGSSTLTWSSTNATACAASGGWTGALPTSGSQSTGALTSGTSYSLTCSGPGGTSAPATAAVTVDGAPVAVPPLPTVTLTANPTTVAKGGPSTLTWTSTNATFCSASGGWSGTLATGGSQSTGSLSASTSYALTCTGAGGTSPASMATVTVNSSPVTPIPTVTLTANPATVANGVASTLTWSSANATACTASGGWTGPKAISGTQSTGALTASANYSLVCTGAGGTSPMATVAVNVVPTTTLAANPTTVASGGASTLTWSSTNATACTASGGWNGTLPVSGTRSTGPLTASTTYALTCTGAGGTSQPASATVTVAPLPTVTLTANPATLASGVASMLTWSSTNATACTASGGWTGAKATNGTQSTGALTASTTYTLTCTGAGGTSPPASATVTVAPVPTATLSVNPTVVAQGTAAVLTWSSTNATSCTGGASWPPPTAIGTNGTVSTGPVNFNSTFSLICAGPGGTSTAATAVVNVVPTATLSANPTSVASGGTSTLTWSSSNATACAGTGPAGWAGTGKAGNGTYPTGTLTATTTYSLTCSGAGGTSATATATVTITNGTVTVSPKTAAITLSQTQQFTASGGGTPTWSVNGTAGGDATVGTISASGLYTPGTAAGSYGILATNGTQSGSATVAVTDLAGVYSYHNDNARDGANAQEWALTPANVNTTSFGKLASCPVDGAVYAQPLWMANVTVNGAKHNVVFVATEHDGVFAFDADAVTANNGACTQLWQANLIDTAHGAAAGETTVPYSLVGASIGDIQPEIGVTGTPVIDPTSGILYVVSKSVGASQSKSAIVSRLHAIDITTGNEIAGAPVVIAGTYPGSGDGGNTVTFVSSQELQRPGLALANGSVYVAFTAHEDAKPWYGWMMSYSFMGGTLTQTAIVNTAPNQKQAGIWMSGGAPAVDSGNKLYVITGNGTFNVGNPPTASSNDYGDSLIQLNTGLQITQYFTPSDQQNDANYDTDFGAGGAALMADLPAGDSVTHALIAGGKDGYIYILNRDNLGGSGDSKSVQKFGLGSQVFATGAVWNGNYYIGGYNSNGGAPLVAYTLSNNGGTPNFSQSSQSPQTFGFPGATPSVSASQTQNGIVWSLDNGKYCTGQSMNKGRGCGPTILYANDANNVATQLWNSNASGNDAAGNAVKFTVPTIANGRVYVGTRGSNVYNAYQANPNPANANGELDIYGLK